uniref:Histone acetyltransferase type B catalytic subunit n=2 Tax=Sarcoptes scabiei TaxID=52283 RepID=A0A834VF83_SARSC
MSNCINLEFNAFENYVSNSNECVRFKLVCSSEDLIDDFENNSSIESNKNDDESSKKQMKEKCLIPSFKPEMSYQFFGENENIFGYKDLIIKVYYSCAQLNIYLGLNYQHRLNKQQTGGIEPDDVLRTISNLYETKVCYNLEEFSRNLSIEKSFIPYGECLKEFVVEHHKKDSQSVQRSFGIYKADNSVPGFVAYHERMQTFLLWFIEAVSFIEIDDNRWDFFVIYEKIPDNETNSTLNCQYCFVGYTTVYRYYAYPQNIRPRISQFLILPPFQRLGLGSKLLETVYENYNQKSVLDITVEGPSDEFQAMRDVVDCKLCMGLSSFCIENLKSGWSSEMAEEAKLKFKLNSKQSRRIYEILKLKITNLHDSEDYLKYRLAIKQRLNAPYVKQINDIEKLRKRKAISEANYALLLKTNQIPREYRIKNLNKQYEDIEREYLQIIEKLNK